MPVLSEREKVKQRVAKLLNMTLDKGASEVEAMTAAEKAAALMAHYDIEASELSLRSARAIQQNVQGLKYGVWKVGPTVAWDTAKFCDCMHWYSPSTSVYTFFGLPEDAEIAGYLFETISRAILAEIAAYKESVDFWAMRDDGNSLKLIRSFMIGMENRICRRLADLETQKATMIREATGRSLVVVKEAQIKEDFAASGIRLRTGQSSGRRIASQDAYRVGQKAGDRISLNTGVRGDKVAGALS